MKYMNYKKERRADGFTLIELLVVIAIIGLLGSIVLASLSSARAKARDARKRQDFRSVSTALALYYDTNRSMPTMSDGSTGVCENYKSDVYNGTMQQLVSSGFLPSIPKSPGGESYCLYNYGPGNSIGFLMVTYLEAAPDSTTGIPPSCRPWAPGTNWCDQGSSKSYCICNPY